MESQRKEAGKSKPGGNRQRRGKKGKNFNPDLSKKAQDDFNKKVVRRYEKLEAKLHQGEESGMTKEHVKLTPEKPSYSPRIVNAKGPGEHPFFLAEERRRAIVEERQNEKRERQERLDESRKKRNRRHRDLSKKTKKGQPVFAPIIQRYLEQIEETIAKEKKEAHR